jgi:hypothetical protein
MPSSGVQTPLCFLFNAGGGTRISVHGDEMAHDATIRKDEEAEGCGSFCSWPEANTWSASARENCGDLLCPPEFAAEQREGAEPGSMKGK